MIIGNEASNLKSLFQEYIKDNMDVTDGKKLWIIVTFNS